MSTTLEIQREIVAQVNDLRLPLYSDDTRASRDAMHVPTTDEQGEINTVCSATGWDHRVSDEDELPIWLAAARLLPILGIVSIDATNPANAAWHWAKARCLFAGAGFAHHDAIAAVLSGLYSNCDLAPGESEADWLKALQAARSVCGWPVHLGRLNWRKILLALDWMDRSDPAEPWHRALALLHVLKHVRTRPERIVVVHAGTAALLSAPDTNVIALSKTTCDQVIQALGCPLGRGKEIHPLTQAVRHILAHVSIDRLLSQKLLADLPGTVIAGPWSSCEPDPAASAGFVQSGLRLTGVWNASNGAIRAYTGSAIDPVAWAWNISNPGDFAETRAALVASMPSTYPTDWPANMLLADFPNLDLSWATDIDAARVLLELPIFASLLRKSGEPLSREFPFVLFLPDIPSMEESTNQGKTALTRTLVRAISPGAPTVVPPDTASAPDNRAFVDILQQYGTAGLDEWAPPSSKSHPLSHANLQTLCTGGGVTFGRVLENTGMVTLRHSLVAGCKAVEFPPDMVSRTLAWPLKQFTVQERNRPAVKARVDSGQAALQLRLAALHQIETYAIDDALAKLPIGANSTLRFDAHATLADLLYELRTGRKCQTMNHTIAEMRARLNRHVSEANTSGVLAMQEGAGYLHVRVPDLFAGVGPDVIGLAQQEMAAVSVTTERLVGRSWNTPSQLIDCLRKARGFPNLQSMLPAISGSRRHASDRQIVMALGRSIRSMVPEQGVFEIPESGWTLERGTDVSNSIRVRLIQKSLIQSPAGQNDTWTLDK